MKNILINNIIFIDYKKIKNREIKSNKYKSSKILIPSKFKFSIVKKFFFCFYLDWFNFFFTFYKREQT